MKRILTLSAVFAFVSLTAVAQTTTTTKAAPASAAKAPKLSEKDIMMCDKNWQVISVEEWGVLTKPPGEKNKTDMMKLTQDGKYEVVMFGIKHEGTWTKSGQYIYFTDADKKFKFNFKVLSVEAAKMKVDHYSDEDGHSIFEYEAK